MIGGMIRLAECDREINKMTQERADGEGKEAVAQFQKRIKSKIEGPRQKSYLFDKMIFLTEPYSTHLEQESESKENNTHIGS